jgi:hypothetical protein
MNQSYVYWLFTQQLERERALAGRSQGTPVAPRRHGRGRQWRRFVQRRRPLGHAVTTPRAPAGCAV